MGYELSFHYYDDHIHVVLVGEDTLRAVIEYWTKIAQVMQSHPQRRLLMEEHLTGTIPDREIHEWSEFMRSLGLPPGTKIAFSYLEERVSEYRFAETLLINRGFVTKVFTDLDAARTWLLSAEVEA
jgi:hypothetical protein